MSREQIDFLGLLGTFTISSGRYRGKMTVPSLGSINGERGSRRRARKLDQVTPHLPDGLRALSNLLEMLLWVASYVKLPSKKSANWESVGILCEDKYWLGVRFSEPEKLIFQSMCRVDHRAAVKLGVGELVDPDEPISSHRYWRQTANLESEQIHFFYRSKVSQMEWLVDFFRVSLALARSIETPDQPPIPKEPEGM